MASRFKLPRYFAMKAYEKLMDEYNELFNKDEISRMVKSDTYKISLYTDIVFCNLLKLGVTQLLDYESHLKDSYKELVLEQFKKRYGFLPTEKKHIDRLDSEMRKKNSKLKELNVGKPKKETKFEEVIYFVQVMNGWHSIDRNMSLYEFYEAYKNALKKVENGKRKG
jgi:hypothetical protein